MYSQLFNAILLADLWIKIFRGVGAVSGVCVIGCLVWWFSNLKFNKKPILLALFCTAMCIGALIASDSKYFQTEYIVMRVAAPQLDRYIDNHPDAIYNPDTALMVNDIALGLVSSIKNLPDLVKRIEK